MSPNRPKKSKSWKASVVTEIRATFYPIPCKISEIHRADQKRESPEARHEERLRLKQKQKIKLFGDGGDIRDHLYIDDLVKIIHKSCYKKDLFGEFIVASQKSFRFLDVAKKILLLKNKPQDLIEFIKLNNKIKKRFFSNLRIGKVLNLKFTKLNNGLRKYVS